MKALISIIFGTILVLPAIAGVFTNNKEKLREAVQTQHWDEASEFSNSLLSTGITDQQKDLYRIVKAISLQRLGKNEESIKNLLQITEQSSYSVWAKVLLMRLAYENHNFELLKTTIDSLSKIQLKGDLKTEKNYYEANLFMENKNWNLAEKTLRKIERPSRGTDLQIPVLESLALVQANTQKLASVCKSLKQIYIKFPMHDWFKSIGPEIKDIHLGNKKFSCSVTEKDFELRRKTLNLSGEFTQAAAEITKWFSLLSVPIIKQKILLAQQAAAEGRPEDSVEILKAAQSGGLDLQLLTPLSFAAARAGDMKLAIATTLKINQILGTSKQGTLALYQAAVWSYQTRDYDTAESNFRKLKLNRLSKAYQKEVQWYLGWLRYLKGDFIAAEKSFRVMQKNFNRKKTKDSSDRLQYWLAMSLLKQNKIDKSRFLFQKLFNRKGMNYYSFLARERLKQIPETSAATSKSEAPIVSVVRGGGYYPTPFGEEAPWPSIQETEVTDEVLASEDNEEINSLSEEEDSTIVAEDERHESSPDQVNSELFSQGEANQKFDRAKSFWSVGLEDFARREVSDLEHYSKNFDIFKRVAEEYKQMGLYNKMSIVGQSFSSRANLSNNKFIYESIYPRAFSEFVEKYGAENNVAQALIWGIMKAESMYRPWVHSPVGALGLMQVMPLTGQKLAEMLAVPNFTPQILLQPQHAIRFGSKYLERLGKKFDHSVQLVAAAYNAGPHRVSQWLYYFGYMQMDEWVEHIPFLETRNYVKRVTTNYMAYNELYGRSLGDTLALIDSVPVQIASAPETKENWE